MGSEPLAPASPDPHLPTSFPLPPLGHWVPRTDTGEGRDMQCQRQNTKTWCAGVPFVPSPAQCVLPCGSDGGREQSSQEGSWDPPTLDAQQEVRDSSTPWSRFSGVAARREGAQPLSCQEQC